MKVAIFTSILAIFGSALAAPVPDAEIEARSVAKIYPSLAVNIFTPDKGTTQFGAAYVFRYTAQGIQHETNTLLSFNFPAGYAGKTCSFSFANGWAPPHTNPNSQKVQLFSVGGPITASNTYTSRPYRDISYGIFAVTDDGSVGTWDGPVPTFPCPASAKTLGFEVAPQNDFDDVSWPLTSGLAVIVI